MTSTFAGLNERVATLQYLAAVKTGKPPLSEQGLAERRKPTGELAALLGAAERPVRVLLEELRRHDLEELRDGGVGELDRRGALYLTLAAFNEAGSLSTDAALRAIVVTFSKRA